MYATRYKFARNDSKINAHGCALIVIVSSKQKFYLSLPDLLSIYRLNTPSSATTA